MNLLIDAVGMVTSVGHDAATSCAAIRAGVTRAAPLADGQVLDPDSQTMVPLVGHAVWGLTEGKAAIPRWISLANHAFLDLRSAARLPEAPDEQFWRRTGLILVSPILDNDRRFFYSPLCSGAMIGETYIGPLTRQLGVPIDPRHVYHLAIGRTGALRACIGAEELLAQAAVDRIIVIAADSYLDGHSLQWLSEYERLKSGERPCGLMPGEAAAAIMVSSAEPGSRSAANPCARIRVAAIDREEQDYLSGERKHGRALARALTVALTTCRLEPPVQGDIYADLNGEVWRAYEFGAALAQISADLLQSGQFIAPAICVGDVGAASALVSVVLAARAFERGYARSASAVLTCMSGSGQVGALVMERT